MQFKTGSSPVERPVKDYPLDVEYLDGDDNKMLMSKGHHDAAKFIEACELWNGGPLEGWGTVHHSWSRTVPDSSGDYGLVILPAKAHTHGAYPVTTIIEDT